MEVFCIVGDERLVVSRRRARRSQSRHVVCDVEISGNFGCRPGQADTVLALRERREPQWNSTGGDASRSPRQSMCHSGRHSTAADTTHRPGRRTDHLLVEGPDGRREISRHDTHVESRLLQGIRFLHDPGIGGEVSGSYDADAPGGHRSSVDRPNDCPTASASSSE
jgi:hypothetical protein